MFKPIHHLAQDLAEGRATSRDLVEQALAAITDPKGEGGLAFVAVDPETARAQAQASDDLRRQGIVPSPLAGIPVSLKDLFDVQGQVTRAGSTILEDAPPAAADATVVARLRAAGAVFVGRTNMSEFAFSGVGLNPHYGTPRNPHDRDPVDPAIGRIPGGSSSGAAVSVTDGMAAMALGTDTGGSVRIPSALCGLTGFKPTARRVPVDGVFPLATSLDSVGPLALDVADCALVDAILSGGNLGAGFAPPAPRPLNTLCLGVPRTLVQDHLDGAVAEAFESALRRLSAAGARLVDMDMPVFGAIAQVNANGGLATAEAYALHRGTLAGQSAAYDPRILARIMMGERQSAADYIQVLEARQALRAEADAQTAPYDALLLPTTPLVAPHIADLAEDADYGHINRLMLRNTSLGNFLDRCAVSLPCQRPGDLPVGLTVLGETGGDAGLLAVASALEGVLAQAA
ncbi:MAG: amidase [Rhodobacterales bacterium]|nr:amidase [Rhodobacterales bacterium]